MLRRSIDALSTLGSIASALAWLNISKYGIHLCVNVETRMNVEVEANVFDLDQSLYSSAHVAMLKMSACLIASVSILVWIRPKFLALIPSVLHFFLSNHYLVLL